MKLKRSHKIITITGILVISMGVIAYFAQVHRTDMARQKALDISQTEYSHLIATLGPEALKHSFGDSETTAPYDVGCKTGYFNSYYSCSIVFSISHVDLQAQDKIVQEILSQGYKADHKNTSTNSIFSRTNTNKKEIVDGYTVDIANQRDLNILYSFSYRYSTCFLSCVPQALFK